MSQMITVSITIELRDPLQLIRDVRERLIEEHGDTEVVDSEVLPDWDDDLVLLAAQHAFDTLGFRSEAFDVVNSKALREVVGAGGATYRDQAADLWRRADEVWDQSTSPLSSESSRAIDRAESRRLRRLAQALDDRASLLDPTDPSDVRA